MQGLQRRPSGVWVARLVVPARLRAAVGRVEFIQSTSTSNLAVAKVVGGELLTQWRRRLLQFDQMANYEELLRLVDGDPILQVGGHLPLRQAAEGAGLDPSVLLRQAAAARADLFVRCHTEPGFVVSLSSLRTAMGGRRIREDDDDDLHLDHGPLVIPGPNQMPDDAVPHEATGVFRVCAEDVPGVATAMLAGKPAQIIALDWSVPDVLFIPHGTIVRTLDDIEVVAADVDALRRRLASAIDPARLESARALRLASVQGRAGKTSKSGHKRLSEGLDAYTREFLPQHIRKPAEIERVRVGISLLIEFMGDVALDEVDAEFLRAFRNGPLATVLARENVVRAKYGTTSMRASIEAVKGTGWEIMSAAERDLRMQWIGRMMAWLHRQGWISEDPAVGLRGESVQSKAERAVTDRAKKPRLPFDRDELHSIFDVAWFRTGCGEMTEGGKTHRSFQPFRFWLPLLALYGGFRIGEACQLWLSDVQQTAAGTWFIDVNESSADKSLKTTWSARRVPLHPAVLEAGFVEWCDRLRSAGYQRVFPELAWSDRVQYAKEPIRAHTQLFEQLGMVRDGTKTFHSFRHNLNTALERLPGVTDVARKRVMGHLPGEGVNERHYLQDRSPDEAIEFIRKVEFEITPVARFDLVAGLAAVRDALARKLGDRRGKEDMGPAPRAV